MKKLKLNLEELDVAQFHVEDAVPSGTGTVHGNNVSTQWFSAPCLFCPPEPPSRSETVC
jgi:hypothetical protein